MMWERFNVRMVGSHRSVFSAGIAVHSLGEAQVCDSLVGDVGEDVSAAFRAVDEHSKLL